MKTVRRWNRIGAPLLRLTLCLGAVALSGCSALPWLGGDKDPNPPTPLVKFSPQVDLRVLWRRDVGHGTDKRRLYLVPAISGGHVIAADARGLVTAVGADDGRQVWRTDLGVPLSGGPASDGSRVIVGSTNGDLIALSAVDGSQLWRSRADSEILSVPRLIGDLVVVHTLDDNVYGFDATNGEVRWRYRGQTPVLILRGSSSPAIVPSGAIVGLTGGRLVELDLNEGVPLWTTRVTPPTGRSELERITDLDADPVVVGDTVYVGTYNGDLAAIDVASGAILWRRTLSVYSGLAADEDALYVTDADDYVWAADRESGAGRWRQEQLAHRRLSAPALLGDLVLVGDYDGYLHGIARNDGHLAARTRIAKGRITARPLVADGRLYVFADDGTLAALTLGASQPAAPTAATAAVGAPAIAEPGGAQTPPAPPAP
ncbi:outer membrane assembly lipoprotein YfgL [Thioflavicoccus mobilis 8321]|uniref:Outer membrane protein assembly factor BamB n=1 Tax=Thioflavicoccus mobilis 8321 TaxID=765912 RepID=L0GZB8_9GAMM|nr:outer membrane protein assembly factor BamB [Thioflavicoccus mobilis]AGA90654.1 outer membrane assembly lipoprotein YfgL [Thioflavicoccus mobilis 8321]